MTTNDYVRGLENLKAALKRALRAFKPPADFGKDDERK